MKSKFKIVDLEKIKTKEGYMFPIYKDWESFHEGFVPQMVYATTIKAGMSKDIIYHKKRTTFLTCIQGDLNIQLMIDNCLQEYEVSNSCDSLKNKIMILGPCIPFKLINQGKTEAIIINCPTHAWKPNSQEMLKFNNWEDYKKWKG